MNYLIALLMFFVVSEVKADVLSSIFSIFTEANRDKEDQEEFDLQYVQIITKPNMNENSAMKVHLVIIYDKSLFQELSQMSSFRYFQMVDQLIKDYPDKMKVYYWDLVAKDRIRNWQKIDTLNDSMDPIGGFIFADYHDHMAAHRARIPNYEKVKVVFYEKDFQIVHEDGNKQDVDAINKTEENFSSFGKISKDLDNIGGDSLKSVQSAAGSFGSGSNFESTANGAFNSISQKASNIPSMPNGGDLKNLYR